MKKENLKIGIYTEDEIFNYMTEQEGGMLGRSMYDAIFDKIHALITETEQLKKDKLILKEKLELSEKARKEAIEYINKNLTISSILDGKKEYCLNNYNFDYRKLLNILDIDKGE